MSGTVTYTWSSCKKTVYQAIQCITFSYLNSDVFISIVYSLNDCRFSYWKLSIKRFSSYPRLLCMSTTVYSNFTIQGLHSSSGRQKTWQMLSPKPLSHSIQQQMRFLTFTKKKKKKEKTLLLFFLFFSPFLYLRDFCILHFSFKKWSIGSHNFWGDRELDLY